MLLRGFPIPILLIAVLLIVACSSNSPAPAVELPLPDAEAPSEPAGPESAEQNEPESATEPPEPEPPLSPPATNRAEEDDRRHLARPADVLIGAAQLLVYDLDGTLLWELRALGSCGLKAQ